MKFSRRIQLCFKLCACRVFLHFERKELIEPGIYSFNPGMSGLAFLPGKRYSQARVTIAKG